MADPLFAIPASTGAPIVPDAANADRHVPEGGPVRSDCPELASPTEATTAVSSFDGPIILDLDETLYLRNSTEDFIDSAVPRLLALVLLRALDLVAPWRFTGGATTRDNWRILLVLTLFPWTILVWKRRVAGLAAQFANTDLILAARNRPSVIVATSGYRPVVVPLIRALGLAGARVVAARPMVFADRSQGKLRMVRDALRSEFLAKSLVVTDSPDDAPLLRAAARGLRTIWPDARFRPAFASVYYPGRYIGSVKRPGQHYVRRGIVQDDLLLWILCSISLAGTPALHVLAVLLLLGSFWAVYEQGYVDNDLAGARREADPRLSRAFWTSELARRRPAPWLWAAVLGLGGLWCLRWPDALSLSDAAVWFTTLAATFGCFWIFNRLGKARRIWPYAILQLARGGAFAVVMPVAPIWLATICAYVGEKWIPYYLYRRPRQGTGPMQSGSVADWNLPLNTIRLLFFMVFSIAVVLAQGPGPLLTWPTAALFGLFTFKSWRELGRIPLLRAAWSTVGGTADRQAGNASEKVR